MTNPLVSIAIPFYNSQQHLSFAIQSVINQTYTNWELLLIDDGGKDHSLEIARSFAARDNRIRVISDGLNKKLAARLNESVCLAKGEYYARMDDDDIMTVDRIERQLNYLLSHAEVDVVGSSAMHIDANNQMVGSQDTEGNTTGFIHPTVMGKVEWFVNNPYSEDLPRAQDMDLWLRTASHSRFYNIPEPLLFYRNTGTPIASRYKKSMQSLRLIAHRHKLYGKSWMWCLRLTAKSYIQQWLYSAFSALGQTDVLVSLRKVKPLDKSLLLSDEDLRRSIAGVE